MRGECRGASSLSFRQEESNIHLLVLPLGKREDASSPTLIVHTRRPLWKAENLDEKGRGVSFARDTEAVALAARQWAHMKGLALDGEVTAERGEDDIAWGTWLEAARMAGPRARVKLRAWSKATPLSFAVRDGNETFPFPLCMRSSGAAAGGQLSLPAGLVAGGHGLAGRLAADDQGVGWDDYRLSPKLRFLAGSWELGLRRGPWLIALRGEEGELVGEADAYYHGTRFGQAFEAKGAFRRQTVGADYGRGDGGIVAADLSTLALSATSRGSIQSWPFTPTIVDLLGVRLGYELGCSVRVKKLHLGGELPWGARARAQGGLNVLRARLDMPATTWNPETLVFGRTNVKQWAFPITALDGIYLTGGLDYRVGGLRLHYTIGQLIPTHVGRAPRPSPSPEPGEEAAEPRSSSGSGIGRVSGGTQHTFWASWDWGSPR